MAYLCEVCHKEFNTLYADKIGKRWLCSSHFLMEETKESYERVRFTKKRIKELKDRETPAANLC